MNMTCNCINTSTPIDAPYAHLVQFEYKQLNQEILFKKYVFPPNYPKNIK